MKMANTTLVLHDGFTTKNSKSEWASFQNITGILNAKFPNLEKSP